MEVEIQVAIESRSPLLMNRFTDAAMAKATSGDSASFAGAQDTPREQAAGKIYLSEQDIADGRKNPRIVIPQTNLQSCIVDAGRFFKSGRSKLTTRDTSIISGCLSIVEFEVPLRHEAPWSVDARRVVNPATKGGRICYRPRFDEWSLEFTILLDTSILGPKLLREVVDAAGKRIGLCDYRPSRKGWFGKFIVTKWVELGKKKGNVTRAKVTTT